MGLELETGLLVSSCIGRILKSEQDLNGRQNSASHLAHALMISWL